MKLTFDKGTIQIQGDVRVPNSTWDERSKTYRAMALYYRDILDFSEEIRLRLQMMRSSICCPVPNFKAALY